MRGFLSRIFTNLGRAIASIGYGAPNEIDPMVISAEFELEAFQTWTEFNLDAD